MNRGAAERAEYGKAVLQELSKRLTAELGKGFNVRNLQNMRQFYLMFLNWNAVRSESSSSPSLGKQEQDVVPHESGDEAKCYALRSELTWTHYRLLIRVEDAHAREWYMHEAADQNWTTRQLERQISTQYYERLLASRDKQPVRKEAAEKLAQAKPEHFIRDPYVLEFLNLKDYPSFS